MKLPKELTTVTTLSKTIALIMFVSMPVVGFFFGRNYQMTLDTIKTVEVAPTTAPIQKGCTMEAKICPDGSAVSRSGPNCEFTPCPTGTAEKGMMCGGIKGIACPTGFTCQYQGKYPDASGTCVKETVTTPSSFTCPTGGYVDCMPNGGPVKSTCSSDYLKWAKANCPNFQGAAY